MYRFLFLLFMAVSASFCTRKHYSYSQPSSTFPEPPSYHNLHYWAAHPWKKDPSDSTPTDIRNERRDSLADVFFVHPTTYTGAKAGWYADLHNEALNLKTDQSAILYQASVFNQLSRVFAPRYRQGHYSAFFTNNPQALASFDTAYKDVREAFLFYLQHYNNNRPIIIAGHSQGAKMALQLLKEFFDGKPLQQQLVAAYAIGWPVPQNYFSQLKVCADAAQTNCFCTWRTYRKGYIPAYIQKEALVSFVTNPLNWKTTDAYAGRKENKGSILLNFNKVVKHTADAQVHQGVLWTSKPKFRGSIFYTTKNYHIADINLYYINLRENIALRIQQFITKSAYRPSR